MSTTDASLPLLPCPFCGHDTPEFVRKGTPRQSCIVECGDCGARHESSDEGERSGSSWNTRAALAQQAPAVAGRPGAVILNGAHVCCEEFDREPCPHQPERRCKACPGNARQAPAAEPTNSLEELRDMLQAAVDRLIAAKTAAPAAEPVAPFDRTALLELFDDYADASADGVFDEETRRIAAQIIAMFEVAPQPPQAQPLKRYDLFGTLDGGGPAEPVEAEDGEWVRYSDVRGGAA